MKRTLLPLCRDELAVRFDMAAEALLLLPAEGGGCERRHLVLAHASGEELCDLILRMDVQLVICGAIEEDYYHYLRWKRVELICDVAGPLDALLDRLAADELKDGDTLPSSNGEALS